MQTYSSFHSKYINPFSTNVPLLYPLKTSENRRLFDVFRGYRSETLVENGLRWFLKYFDYISDSVFVGLKTNRKLESKHFQKNL